MTAGHVLIVSAVLLLFGGVVTGVALSQIRSRHPEAPKHLRLAHTGAYIQTALLLGIVLALGISNMSSAYNTTAALVVSASAFMLFIKDVINWRTGVEDEFREKGLGYQLAVGFGFVHLAGLVMVAVAVVSGL